MDLIGHCLTIEMSKTFDVNDIYSPKINEFMFVNVMHCHDWGYKNCWKYNEFPPYLQETVKRVRAHLVCDWVIHYGTNQTTEKTQTGWAYCQIERTFGVAHAYFSELKKLGLIGNRFGEVPDWPLRKKLNVLHSLVEYAIDLRLAENLSKDRFETLKQGLLSLKAETGYGSRRWIKEMFINLQVSSDRPESYLDQAIDQMINDAESTSVAGEFAVRTTLHKIKIVPSMQSIKITRYYLEKIAEIFTDDEVNNLVIDIANAIKKPEKFYTGPLSNYNELPTV